jgi:hypothetical protein
MQNGNPSGSSDELEERTRQPEQDSGRDSSIQCEMEGVKEFVERRREMATLADGIAGQGFVWLV